MSVPVNNQSNFNSQRLGGWMLELYNECVQNLSCEYYRASARLPSNYDGDLSAAVHDVFTAVIFDHPELFYVEQIYQIESNGANVTLIFESKYPENEIDNYWHQIDDEINRLVEYLNTLQCDFEKLHAINEYLCLNVREELEIDSTYADVYGTLILKRARCEGFSKAAKLILDRIGIDNVIASGDACHYGQSIPHSWNIAKCDGLYYHFDFTYNASYTMYGIAGQVYMFGSDIHAYVDRVPQYDDYPNCCDESKTFWALHNGFVEYHSDLCRIDIVPYGSNYIAIAKFDEMPTEYEFENEMFDWMRSELSAENYAMRYTYSRINEHNIVIFYFVNVDGEE